jgi:ketosteroid isomerase-like protein
MSEENVETTQRSLRALDRRDRDAWLAERSQGCEVIPTADWPETEIRGRDAAWDFYVEVLDTFQQSSVSEDAEVVYAGPDSVLIHCKATFAAGKAGPRSGSTTGAFPPSAEARSFATTGSRIAPRPSKPPGCRSRRCLRRTSICSGAPTSTSRGPEGILPEAVHPDFVWDTTTFRGGMQPETCVGVDETNRWLAEWLDASTTGRSRSRRSSTPGIRRWPSSASGRTRGTAARRPRCAWRRSGRSGTAA